MNDSLTPSRALKSFFARSRSRAIRVTSTSMTVVSWAEVCNEETIRWAITLRNRLIFSVVPRRAETAMGFGDVRSEEHTSELQSRRDLVCRLLLEKKKRKGILKSKSR